MNPSPVDGPAKPDVAISIERRRTRVLVVDADPLLRADLVAALTGAGHEVELASSGQAGLALAAASSPNIVIFNLLLPDMSGLDFCALVRSSAARCGYPSLLVLSSACREEDRVAAFEAGAEDYVTKPPSTRELLLRIRALGRRRSTAPPDETLTVGELRIERGSRRADVAGTAIELTRREFDVLLHLAERRGRVQTRDALVADVWGEISDSARVVDTTIKRLRKKLGAAAPAIKTVRGVGYKLLVEGSDTS